MLRRAARTAAATFAALGRARLSRLDVKAGTLAFHRLCADICREHNFQIVVEGQPPPGPYVLVTNHLSYLDPIVLCALSPHAPIAKAEVDGWPLFGAAGRAHGAIFVR